MAVRIFADAWWNFSKWWWIFFCDTRPVSETETSTSRFLSSAETLIRLPEEWTSPHFQLDFVTPGGFSPVHPYDRSFLVNLSLKGDLLGFYKRVSSQWSPFNQVGRDVLVQRYKSFIPASILDRSNKEFHQVDQAVCFLEENSQKSLCHCFSVTVPPTPSCRRLISLPWLEVQRSTQFVGHEEKKSDFNLVPRFSACHTSN